MSAGALALDSEDVGPHEVELQLSAEGFFAAGFD